MPAGRVFKVLKTIETLAYLGESPPSWKRPGKCLAPGEPWAAGGQDPGQRWERCLGGFLLFAASIPFISHPPQSRLFLKDPGLLGSVLCPHQAHGGSAPPVRPQAPGMERGGFSTQPAPAERAGSQVLPLSMRTLAVQEADRR